MEIASLASLLGRHEFLIRRFHSLTGLVPVGGFLVVHLLTNASILDGPQTFQARVDQIHSLGPTTLLFLEWAFIFLPIWFHGVVGMLIVARGKRNVTQYPYPENIRYTLQRATGVMAFAFVLYHVFHMHGWLRWPWWHENVAMRFGGALFDPQNAPATLIHALRGSTLEMVLYAFGVLACVYHLANGLWTMGITWGIWTSPHSQRWASVPCAVFGTLLAIVGLGALYGVATTTVPETAVSAEGPHAGSLPHAP